MTVIFDPEVAVTEDGGREQCRPLPTDQDSLLSLVRVLFEDYWNEMWFRLLIEGSALEVAAPNAPRKIGMYDGYVTVDFGRWHFHVCIGEHTASGPGLGRIRRCARAEMYRRIGKDDTAVSWGLRLFNDRDEQVLTVMLPTPFLTNTQELTDEPIWAHLEAWDRIRADFPGLAPDPRDRAGQGFRHS
ncbi:DUF7676 family protein [Rhodococcus phenolicus]|uniref:DUF7676 family protein n=1 Tax=Rhodococcus phenolicus TaxID=263849 RepID=UPI0009ED934A|nr:hypothetical protein [Rhodococcus phenolicus]